MTRTFKNIYTIPPSISFTDTLAKDLIKGTENNPAQLSNTLILLPTRRACRSMQEAFLRQSNGIPLLLPQMKSFGDIDAEDLLIQNQKVDELTILPAISPLERQILLSQIIGKISDFAKNPAQNMMLASALGQLLDQIYTEGLDFADLPNIVDREAFANHWQITLDFLSILSEHWPRILKERNVIDAADRRIQLMARLNQQWQTTPPDYPIIAAGTTASIPATAALLKTICNLPQGCIILPGLDTYLNDTAWKNIQEGHPQATLKALLNTLDIDRTDVQIWQDTGEENLTREKIFSYVMTPPENTDQWTKISFDEKQKNEITKNLSNIKRYDCATQQDEAQIIALILRETLEHPTKTAALITPDRNLAKRVRVLCQKWSIDIDDSGGKSLSDSQIGKYLQLSARAMIDGITPLSLLAFLKHDLNKGKNFNHYRSAVRSLDKDILRGLKPPEGFESLLNICDQKSDEVAHLLLSHLQNIMQETVHIFSDGTHDFKKLLSAHLNISETLATSATATGEEILWVGEAGENAAQFFSELYAQADQIGDVTGAEYLEILNQLMRGVTIRPRYGTHPRLMILGQLEARLIQTDRVILAGLNEGTWPPEPGHDPWMSRPMRQNFGLPLPERSTTLAAHDFVQGACAKEVFLTRAERVDDAPSVPARWLQRLDTFLTAIDIDPTLIIHHDFADYAQHLSAVYEVQPTERPRPCPPLSARPRHLSVTKIEPWLKDPYQIYASKILKLSPLEPLEKNFDQSERGTILHAIMENFIESYPKKLPPDAPEKFMETAKRIFNQTTQDTTIWNFWRPRLEKISYWITNHETEWRQNTRVLKTEAKGILKLTKNLETPFTLTARVDRLDQMADGTVAIIDYKSGNSYSAKKIESAALPQLPLEGLILEKNGFDNIKDKKVSHLEYWKLTGSSPAGEITSLKDKEKIQSALDHASYGLRQLIQTFDSPETPYIAIPNLDNAPAYNNYAHLERIKEWAALGEHDTNTEAA